MTKLTIGPGRLSFPAIFEPASAEMGGKYQLTILLPPDYDTKPLFAALEEAAVAKWGADKSKWPKNMNGPKSVIRDAAEKSHLAGYEPGWKFISLKSKAQPGIVGPLRESVTDPKEAYAGRWVRVTARAFAYDTVLKGVGFGLQNTQLLSHDTAFSGAGRAQDDFDDYAEELGGEKKSDWAD
ncbi:Protein of unknown function DUF2815 [uncultured Caudovirales phage]|uniref:DUF2815 family protein n=1 Tax=uncultured Caudovirales phage TaxID=2100421 RepID=A0A6J5KTW0_9CAUD|nr:Protein of unknown function DUF2815 [uncultured Caudovirales phage]